MNSKLRPETTASTEPAMPRDTALYLILDSVERRGKLIHGRLHGPNGLHCAIGAFWADNPGITLSSNLINEVAAVNDSLGPNATPKERWSKVRSWLRWKLRTMTPAKKA